MPYGITKKQNCVHATILFRKAFRMGNGGIQGLKNHKF